MRSSKLRSIIILAALAALAACGTMLGIEDDPGRKEVDGGSEAATDLDSGFEAGDAPLDGGLDATRAKLVFVTSAKFFGDLGGTAGGDEKCNAEAKANGLTGAFVAYLADVGGVKPWQRVGSEKWARVDGQIAFADNPAKAPPGIPLDLTADGGRLTPDAGEGVWTGATGQFGPPQDYCADGDGDLWATSLVSSSAGYGDPHASGNGNWHLRNGATERCDQRLHLYCFEK